MAEAVDAAVARLGEAAELLRAGDRDAVAGWHGRRRPTAGPCSRPSSPAARCTSCESGSQTGPGIVAELALELGRAGVNIEDMALYPAADMTSGAISLYVAGDEEAERAEALVASAGLTTSRRAE